MPRGGAAIPPPFWAGTACGLAGGWCLRHAVRAVRRERQRRFHRLMLAAAVLGVGFALFQALGVWTIASRHVAVPGRPSSLNGILAAIVLLHAAHFLGGLAVLGVTVRRALRDR